MSTLSLLSFIAAFCAGVLALAVVFQSRRSLGHWFFSAGMATFSAESFLTGLVADSLSYNQIAFWENWRYVATAFIPGAWLAFSAIYARGNAIGCLREWRLSLFAASLLPIGCVFFFNNNMVLLDATATPGSSPLTISNAAKFLHTCVLLCCVLVLVNLERTFRASVGTMRWRIKFMVLGLGVIFTVRAYTSSQALLFRGLTPGLHVLDATALLVGCALLFRTLLRTGHFDVSVYPSHSVLHNSFTVMLAGVYLVIVGVLAKVAAWLGGDAGFQLKALIVLVAVVGLSVVLMSDRVRLLTKQFVSRHFQRPMYDYRTVWHAFTLGTTRRVEQSELCTAIAKMVSEIFQALSVTLWAVDDKKENLIFMTSTSLSEVKAEQIRLDSADAAEVIKALSQHPEPIDIDVSKEHWAAALRRSHPEEFRRGGNRVAVPLLAGGDLLGVLVLGDRVGGLPFSMQDLDLLKTVGDQAAASLLNIQLSQRLSQAKQLEAFQAMSAFFVHDLKNTASTLSLMLQNLPVHYDDPKFREDALRGIGKTVEHINDVISRLSVLRHELALKSVDCDFNELVADTLKAFPQVPGIELVQELQPLPHIRIDPNQIQKVVTNLLLNAKEALAKAGQICVRTSQQNGWAVLAIRDNGCGMPADFISSRLFRPFQTTKKKGIGIGMFHCKMIVEAHQGKILVESEPGKGTEFRVLLPLGG